MPTITVKLPHSLTPEEALLKAQPALEKTMTDFQGHSLQMQAEGSTATFSFKSMAFTIKGKVEAAPAEVTVTVDLPFAAIMFKDQAERAIAKNVKRALAPPEA